MKHERYFGIHFDFHANNTAEIGLNTDPKDIEKYIEDANPDFIQCDCKGHAGNTCYPSKLGNAAKNLKADNLRIWVDTAKKHNLPIYVHYSGVLENRYVQEHPDEAGTSWSDPVYGGKIDATSLFSPYVDKLLIPQLKELCDDYGVTGVWIDGDCWGVNRDFSKYAQPYLKENMTEQEHNAIMREAYTRYLKHYVDELHAHNPNFIVASNWAYTSYMPESIKADVDFLSGDYPNYNSVHIARYEARCIANRGKPWDLMAWGFERDHDTEKPAAQLMQEAAMVVSLGGGFQVYITQNGDGSAKRTNNPRLKPLGRFMAERKPINFKKEPFGEIGVYYDEHTRYNQSNIYNAAGSTRRLIGALDCVLDAQYTAEVFFTYQMEEKLNAFKAVVVPEWDEILPENKEKLVQYAKQGGHLVVMGEAACRQFAAQTAVSLGETKEAAPYLLANDGAVARMDSGNVIVMKNGSGTLLCAADTRYPFGKAYRTEKADKGQITFIPFALGSNYFVHKNYMFTDLMSNVLGRPMVEIDHKYIDITLQKENGALLLNLVNLLQGRHSLETTVYDFVPEVHDITLTVHGTFKKVSMPLGESFTYTTEADCVHIHLDKLEIHSVIRLDT